MVPSRGEKVGEEEGKRAQAINRHGDGPEKPE